jgi:hypothetical protein
MTHSTFDQHPPSADLATGYDQSGVAVPGGHNFYPEMAAAGLWTTPSDLARFAIAVQDSIAGTPRALLEPSIAQAMATRTLNNWGLGAYLGPPDGPPIFEHAGDDRGFQAHLIAFTAGERQGVAIMTNGDGGGKLIPEILGAVARTYGWSLFKPRMVRAADVSPERLARLAGVYDIAGVASLTITAKDDQLSVDSPALGPRAMPLLPLSETEFMLVEYGATIDFVPGSGGGITGLRVSGQVWNWQASRRSEPGA